jgi:hypothetical protein
LANGVALDQVAQFLKTSGRSAVGNVVISSTGAGGRKCGSTALYANWSDLALLRDTYGWSFMSAGQENRVMTTLSRDEQRAESCGSLHELRSHGHWKAWGLFAYPGNEYTFDIQADVVSTCFAFGRRYGSTANSRSGMAFPWFQKTASVNGGRCTNTALPCSNLNTRYKYASRATVLTYLSAQAGQWRVAQFHRLVTGRFNGGQKWDCTSPDPRDHWTSHTELYCWPDFVWVVNHLPASVRTTDPASVAQAWGRSVG